MEPGWSDVRSRDTQPPGPSSFVFELALAPRRGICADQRRDALPLRAVDHEGEVLEVFVTKRRDRRAALKFLKRVKKRYGQPKVIVTDRLRFYRAAMNVIGNGADHECGRWLNNRAENSHLPFRRREHTMQRFRREKTLQKFVSVDSAISNHFNHERHLISRDAFKGKREAALVEWQQLSTA